jgi:hypothetical protein|tara:strand:+ start:3280 stop:3990 length:711 start_codon:yes stop_codon:yes gene_type:complete
MTTHFTSGVTNVGADSTLGKLKAPAPHKYHTYFNDFDTYLASDWTITTTEGGSGDASEALADGDGGLLLITNDDADNDNDFLQLVKEGFKYETSKQLAFNIRFKTNDATQTDIVAGLQLTDTSPLDVTDGIFFLKEDGAATISFIVEKDSTQSTLTLPNSLADDTFMTLGFVYEPKDQKFHVFQNNVLAGTVVSTNAPDNEELTVSFGIQNGAAAAKTLTVDYIGASKERTATTEL